ncbi:MAG: hypothetical protein U9O78_05040, partial [Patescibacteria group bacterium]|nr:hypothetical protein [Patescibacteria group bacterium]
MLSGHSRNKTSFPPLFKRFSPKFLFGSLTLLFLAVGIAAAFVLTRLNQDVRQQARIPDYECQTASDCGNPSQWRCIANSCSRTVALTPTPIPKNCGWGAHGSTACSGWSSCVECVNGESVSVDRSKCQGQACAPQHSCGSSPHGSHACSSLSQCVVCDDGAWRSTGRSGCAGQACGPSVAETDEFHEKLARYQNGELEQMCAENMDNAHFCRNQSEDSLLRVVFPELSDTGRETVKQNHYKQEKLARYQNGELEQMCVEDTGNVHFCQNQSEGDLLGIVFPELENEQREKLREDHHEHAAAQHELEVKLERYQNGELEQMCIENTSTPELCRHQSEDSLLKIAFPELSDTGREAVRQNHYDYLKAQNEQEKIDENIGRYQNGELEQMCVENTGNAHFCRNQSEDDLLRIVFPDLSVQSREAVKQNHYEQEKLARYQKGELEQMCVENTGNVHFCRNQSEDSLLRIVFPDLSDNNRENLKDAHDEAVRQAHEAEKLNDILTNYVQGDASSLNNECLKRHSEKYCFNRTEEALIAEFAPGFSDQEVQDLVDQHEQTVTIASQEAKTQEQIRVDYIFHQTYGVLEMPQNGDTVSSDGAAYVYGDDGWEEVRGGGGADDVYNTLVGGEPNEGDTMVIDGANYTYTEVCHRATGCSMTWQEDNIFQKASDWLSNTFNPEDTSTVFREQNSVEPEMGNQIVIDGEVYEYKMIDGGMGVIGSAGDGVPGWSKIGATGDRQDNPEEEYEKLYASVAGEPEVGDTVMVDGKTYYYYGDDDGWDLSQSSSDLELYYAYTTGANIGGELVDRCREVGGDSEECKNSEYALGVVYPNLNDDAVAQVVGQRYEDIVDRVLSTDAGYDASGINLDTSETAVLNTFRATHAIFGDSTTQYVVDPNLQNTVELGTKIGVTLGSIIAAPAAFGAIGAAEGAMAVVGTVGRTWMITSSAYSLGESSAQAFGCDQIVDPEERSQCRLQSGLGIVSSAAGVAAPALGTSAIEGFMKAGQYIGVGAGVTSTAASYNSMRLMCDENPDSPECKWSRANFAVSGLGATAGVFGVGGQAIFGDSISAQANLYLGVAADVGGGAVDFNRSRQACIESGGDVAACTRAVLDTLAGIGMGVSDAVGDYNRYKAITAGDGGGSNRPQADVERVQGDDGDDAVRQAMDLA